MIRRVDDPIIPGPDTVDRTPSYSKYHNVNYPNFSFNQSPTKFAQLSFTQHLQRERVLFGLHFKVLLLCLLFQYFHAVATNVAYFLHIPREPLWDLGFILLPVWTSQANRAIMYAMVLFTILFGLSPFYYSSSYYINYINQKEAESAIQKVNHNKDETEIEAQNEGQNEENVIKYHSESSTWDWTWGAFKTWLKTSSQPKRCYTTVMLARFASTGVLAQCLRIVTFLVTTLPGPNPHCRPDSLYYNPPTTLNDILFHRTYAMAGCGDLVFSSHCLLVVLCALTYSHYGISHIIKVILWAAVALHGLATVAAREHYMLDVFIAWYTVPLVWVAYEWSFPDKLPASFRDDHEYKNGEEDVGRRKRQDSMLDDEFPVLDAKLLDSMVANTRRIARQMYDDEI